MRECQQIARLAVVDAARVMETVSCILGGQPDDLPPDQAIILYHAAFLSQHQTAHILGLAQPTVFGACKRYKHHFATLCAHRQTRFARELYPQALRGYQIAQGRRGELERRSRLLEELS